MSLGKKIVMALSILVLFLQASNTAHAQLMGNNFAKKAVARKRYPIQGRIYDISGKGESLALVMKWGEGENITYVTAFGHQKLGIYLLRREYRNIAEAFGLGNGLLKFITERNGVVKKGQGFDPQQPYVLRWNKGVYQVSNEDFQIHKSFDVLNQLFFFVALPSAQQTPERNMLYTPLEVSDSVAFRSLKRWRWKGTKKDLAQILPGLSSLPTTVAKDDIKSQ